jgi:hypothetical protein
MPTFSKRRKAAFGSNRYCEVVLKSAVSLARGMFSIEAGREPKRAPHLLSHQEECLWIGSRETCNQGSTEGSTDGWLSSLTTP